MSYKELVKQPEQAKPVSAPYDILGCILMVAMFCATLLMSTNMWIQQRQAEMAFLRGSN